MISTENGFWKFFMKDDLGKYVLYHRNIYEIKNSHYDKENAKSLVNLGKNIFFTEVYFDKKVKKVLLITF